MTTSNLVLPLSTALAAPPVHELAFHLGLPEALVGKGRGSEWGALSAACVFPGMAEFARFVLTHFSFLATRTEVEHALLDPVDLARLWCLLAASVSPEVETLVSTTAPQLLGELAALRGSSSAFRARGGEVFARYVASVLTAHATGGGLAREWEWSGALGGPLLAAALAALRGRGADPTAALLVVEQLSKQTDDRLP